MPVLPQPGCWSNNGNMQIWAWFPFSGGKIQAVAAAGLQLRSGQWVSSLVYADDVALLSSMPQGLQQLIDGMRESCMSAV